MSEERALLGVRLSNPDKMLFAEQGITKSALADYYVSVAERMLPHVARRPVTLVRCPAGSEKKCFYQRHAASGVPAQFREVLIPGFDEPYLYLKDAAGLVAAVQLGTLELHPWGVTVDRPDLYLARISKAEREGRIFIDYLRNDPTSTAVGAYSTRSRPGAPASLPIEWEQVAPGLDSSVFTIRTVPDLIAGRPDPWARIGEVRQPIAPAIASLAA